MTGKEFIDKLDSINGLCNRLRWVAALPKDDEELNNALCTMPMTGEYAKLGAACTAIDKVLREGKDAYQLSKWILEADDEKLLAAIAEGKML